MAALPLATSYTQAKAGAEELITSQRHTQQTATANTNHYSSGNTGATSSTLVLSGLPSQPSISSRPMVTLEGTPTANTGGPTQAAVTQSASSGSTVVAVTEADHLQQVLSGLQQSGELSSVLQHQPNLVEDLSAIAAGEVSNDPESLRFQYQVEPEPVIASRNPKKSKPTVYREQDRFLPIHNVSRIMRNAIPRNGKVSKDAKECMQECVSEFVSFITSEASDKCIQEKRKTITGDDILLAMATLGFDSYIEPLRLYLQKYREFTKADKIATTSSVVTNNGSTSLRLVNNGATTTNHQQPVTPTVAMSSVTMPTSGSIATQRQQSSLEGAYDGYSGHLT